MWVRGEAGATVFTHRDYHAQNLLWLPERGGVARVGMLDFQDALRAHPAWDLTHLLQDARRDVSPELESAMLDRFLAARRAGPRDLPPRLPRARRLQRRAHPGPGLARQVLAGRYRQFMPRTWRYLERNLQDPAMTGLKAWFDRHVPPEAGHEGAPAMVLAGLGTRTRPLTDTCPRRWSRSPASRWSTMSWTGCATPASSALWSTCITWPTRWRPTWRSGARRRADLRRARRC